MPATRRGGRLEPTCHEGVKSLINFHFVITVVLTS
jgi:hypothetical protein